MEPILEFITIFDDEEYVINIQTKPDLLSITIELESKGIYWSKSLDSKTLSEITSQMGSYKSLKVFSEMLIQALSKKNDSLSLNFCSLNEIQQLSGSSDIQNNNDENNIKKYLMMIYTSFEKVVYPIQMEFLGNNPNKELLQRTIKRLKNKILKYQNEKNNVLDDNVLSKNNYSNYNDNIPINYNEFERLKRENEALLNKIKTLQTKSVNDDIFKKYNELSEKYDTYKKMMENKMNFLVTSLEELKEKESQAMLEEKEKKANPKNKNLSKINELEKKLEISLEQLSNERRQNTRIIDEKNREIDSLKKEIKTYKESEKIYKVKISNLEKELEREKKGSAYYKNKAGSKTQSRRAKSYYSEGSVSCNESYISSYSKKTTTSYLKKNLIPNANKTNSYLRAKNYSPYASKKKDNNRKNSKSKSRSRSGSKKSSGTNSIVAKSIKGPSTLYQRTYKSPYRYEPNNNKNSSKKKITNKNRISPSKNLYKKNDIPKEVKKKEIKNNFDFNYDNNENEYNKKNNINNNSNNFTNNISIKNDNNEINIESDKNNNLNEDNSIANRLSRLQALISQVKGK
jgi:hypothetical protein